MTAKALNSDRQGLLGQEDQGDLAEPSRHERPQHQRDQVENGEVDVGAGKFHGVVPFCELAILDSRVAPTSFLE